LRRRSSTEGCRAWYGAAPPVSRLLRTACGGGLTAGPDPGSLCGPSAAGTKGQAAGLPPAPHGTPHTQTRAKVTTETVIYRHCCDDP
jgi:hypothetical protein